MSEITELAARRLLVDYTRDMSLSDEDPARIVDRTFTDDAVWVTDGTQLSRDQLIAHAAPARKNVTAIQMRAKYQSKRPRISFGGTMRRVAGSFSDDSRM